MIKKTVKFRAERLHNNSISFLSLILTDGFPWAEGSDYADPPPDQQMPSHDYGQSYVFPEPANPGPVFPFPNSPYVIPEPAVAETQTVAALPVQPKQRQVLLPVEPTNVVATMRVSPGESSTVYFQVSILRFVWKNYRFVS